MYKLERYEFSATDSLYEKLDAKLGNYLVRSEEKAEAKHAAYMQKMREKYAKAKAKADQAEKYLAHFYNREESAESRETKFRVLNID